MFTPSHSSLNISIHAPVKGATVFFSSSFLIYQISIHAPVKGATAALAGIVLDASHFNPRSREGSDLIS